MPALIDLGSKVNTIYPSFVKQLGLPIRLTDVEAQKIDSITLEIYGMVVTAFSMVDKANRGRFFEKTFPVINVSLEVVLGMLFFTLNDADIDFSGQKLR